MQLGWITEKGDKVEVKDITNIWDINEKYLLVNTDYPIKLEEDPQPNEDGVIIFTQVFAPSGASYLIDKQTESIFELKGK